MKRARKQPCRSEFEWIGLWQRFQKPHAGVVIGIGDDCAVIRTARRGLFGLLKCDACVAGVHFTPSTDPGLVGRKVMARTLSDIAAMGGRPRFALISATVPRRMSDRAYLKLYRGLCRAARRFGCEIVGGDTSRSPSGLVLSVFLYGEVEQKFLLRRSGARPGHDVFVTGPLGGSLRGRHLRFAPRLEEARWLARRFRPTATIDLSDGLGSDLHRLAEQSGVGFEIASELLPCNPGCGITQALYDGEDYELLFTVPRSRSAGLIRAWRSRFGMPLFHIGVVQPQAAGIRLIDRAGRRTPIRPSYDHFRRHA